MKTKRFFLIALLTCATFATASAGVDRAITVDRLPAKAQQFIKTHFSGKEVSYAKSERELFSVSYDVFFVDGIRVEFNGSGDWEKVDCLRKPIPEGIVPTQIAQIVERNQPGAVIVKIDRDRDDYEVELANGVEMTFDTRFNLIDIDY